MAMNFDSPIHRGFGSDNHSGIHPALLQALVDVNQGHAPSYGTDPLTEKAHQIFRQQFGDQATPFFVFNGTAANVLCIQSLIKSHHSVICAQTSHIQVDECGAPEAHVGCKLMAIPSPDGKIRPQDIEKQLIRRGDQHYAQPRLVSITQPTELGTVYTMDELRDLRDFTKKNGLYLHIDGARLIYAARHLKVSLQELTSELGIDALSFGGTKNGLLFGEAVILFDKDLAKDFKFIRKQTMQLPSKMRFLSAQFIRLLEGDLWKEIADHGIKMAQLLAQNVQDIPQVQITQKVESNAVFARLPSSWIKPLRNNHFFYVWNESTWEVRWMTTFDTQPEDIKNFVACMKKVPV